MLQRHLKHAKKEWKEEAVMFEPKLEKLNQELKNGEKTWSPAEKKFLEEAVQMTMDLQKLRVEVREWSRETE